MALRPDMLTMLNMIRLDYLSCVLTVLATILIGRKLWQGWVVAAVNSAVVCIIGVRTAQFGFVPANLLCIALYTSNLVTWRFRSPDHAAKQDSKAASLAAIRARTRETHGATQDQLAAAKQVGASR